MPIAPVARGITPIQAHTGPLVRPSNQPGTDDDASDSIKLADIDFRVPSPAGFDRTSLAYRRGVWDPISVKNEGLLFD